MLPLQLLTLLGAGTALAQHPEVKNLFVTSYSGTISTLQLSPTGQNGTYQLQNVSVDLGCAPSPSQIVMDKAHGSLWCIGEAAAGGNGSLTAYSIMNGTLVQRAGSSVFPGPVYGTLYGQKNDPVRPIVLAHYGAGGLSTWNIAKDLSFTPINPNITYPPPNPLGPVPAVNASQQASHPHSVILDPTGQYIIVPDLGTDLVHVHTHDSATGALKEAGKPLKGKPGSGPRHAAFSVQGNNTYMYLVSELDATLNGYAVNYLPNAGGLEFKQFYSGDTNGNQKRKNPIAPAEVRITPDNHYLIVSNRNDSSFELPNNNPANKTTIPSDSLATYKLAPNGTISFTQLWPAGGSFARSMDINKKGDMVAVGLQNDGRVVVFKRDVASGMMDKPVAWFESKETGLVTAVKWDEEIPDDGSVGRADNC